MKLYFGKYIDNYKTIPKTMIITVPVTFYKNTY